MTSLCAYILFYTRVSLKVYKRRMGKPQERLIRCREEFTCVISYLVCGLITQHYKLKKEHLKTLKKVGILVWYIGQRSDKPELLRI